MRSETRFKICRLKGWTLTLAVCIVPERPA